MKEINIENIYEKLNNLNIIDIRDNYLFNIGNIPNSKNIPKNFLLMNTNNYLSFDETYYIYCNYGYDSKKVCNELSNKGYDVINKIGGYNSFKIFKQNLNNHLIDKKKHIC